MNNLPAIEIYSIGTELLNGQIQDTNSWWMARQIAALGGYVRRIAILDDDAEEISGVLSDACRRGTRIAITSGGLGPTPDDLTVEVIAGIMGVEVAVDESLVGRFMRSRGIERREEVNPGLLKMATIPEGATAHPNPAGVAPCVEVRVGGTTLFALPGPPREVEALFRQSVEPVIAELYSRARVSRRVAVNLPGDAVRSDPAERHGRDAQHLPEGVRCSQGAHRGGAAASGRHRRLGGLGSGSGGAARTGPGDVRRAGRGEGERHRGGGGRLIRAAKIRGEAGLDPKREGPSRNGRRRSIHARGQLRSGRPLSPVTKPRQSGREWPGANVGPGAQSAARTAGSRASKQNCAAAQRSYPSFPQICPVTSGQM